MRRIRLIKDRLDAWTREAEKTLRFFRNGGALLSFSNGTRIPFSFACFFAILFFLALILRCSIERPEEHHSKSFRNGGPARIAFIPGTGNADWWSRVREGAEREARESGVKFEWLSPGDDAREQSGAFVSALETHPDAVLLVKTSPEIDSLAREAERDGILCIAVLVPCDACSLAVATDDFHFGAEAMRCLANSIGGKGKIVLASSSVPLDGKTPLSRGLRETAKREYPKIEIAQERSGATGTALEAEGIAEAMLARHSGISGAFAADRTAAKGMLSALRKHGLSKTVGFVAVGSSPELARALKDGEISHLLVRNPREIGAQAVRIALRRLRGESVPDRSPIPFMPVDASNLDRMTIEDPGALGL